MLLIFVDVADAYGSVLLDKLLEMVRRLKIWSAEETDAFRYLWSRSCYRLGKSKGYTTKGIFQGSKLSCELFALYLGEVMMKIRERTK